MANIEDSDQSARCADWSTSSIFAFVLRHFYAALAHIFSPRQLGAKEQIAISFVTH